jgi:hypothetical protein
VRISLLATLLMALTFTSFAAGNRKHLDKMPVLEIKAIAIVSTIEQRFEWGNSFDVLSEKEVYNKLISNEITYSHKHLKVISGNTIIAYDMEIVERPFDGSAYFKFSENKTNPRFIYNPETSFKFDEHGAFFNLFLSPMRSQQINLYLKGSETVNGKINVIIEDENMLSRFDETFNVETNTNVYVSSIVRRLNLEPGMYNIVVKSDASW